MSATEKTQTTDIGLVLLHALPLDGSMWAAHLDLLPGSTYAPTLYGFGNSLEAWAGEVLRRTTPEKLIVVGCSVGGSCALEVAALSPERIAALVLIGTKAKHSPDPALHASAIDLLEKRGIGAAWMKYWAPLFSDVTDRGVVAAAKNIATSQPPEDIARGVTAFHTRRSRDRLLSDCQCPIIVVTGEDDVAPGPQASAALAASARHGSLHVVPSCGHYVPLERSAVFRSILKDVIAATDV